LEKWLASKYRFKGESVAGERLSNPRRFKTLGVDLIRLRTSPLFNL
jgi:hypothetical protein